MSTALAPIPTNPYGPIIELVISALTSPHSKRAYSQSLKAFLAWTTANSFPFTKHTCNLYRAKLLNDGLAASTINVALAAIRKLALEASDNGLMDATVAAAIQRVDTVKASGVRVGKWLTMEQASAMLAACPVTLPGLRDKVILALLFGCGLRRSEASKLTRAQLTILGGRTVLTNVNGKGNKMRTIPVPAWAASILNDWLSCTKGEWVISATSRWGTVGTDPLSESALYDVVQKYGRLINVNLAPHDCRRTFANLAYAGGGKLDQIQLSLGHSDMRTTQNYLGLNLDLRNAPCDAFKLG